MKKLLATVLLILATIAWAQDEPPYIYGPVEPGDNLWFVAQEFTEHYDITTEQAVGLLFQNNVRAFMHGDVNSLMAGVFLTLPDDTPRRIPEPVEVIELALETEPEEEDEVHAQGPMIESPGAIFEEATTYEPIVHQAEAAAHEIVANETVLEETPLQDTVAEITPEFTPELPDVSQGTQVASLELLMPGSGTMETLLGIDELAFVNVLDSLKRDLSIAQEAIETERRAKDTLQSQLKDLQIQINALTELVTLKDQEISTTVGVMPQQLAKNAQANTASLSDKLPANVLFYLQQAGENQMVLFLVAIAIASMIMYLWDSFSGNRASTQMVTAAPQPQDFLQTMNTMDFAADDLDGEEYEGDPPSDPIQTKLDLARAYLDIGDHENAVVILKEVLQEGNEQQTTTAQMLLDNIKK